jgi:hypothetical protein
MKPEKFLHCISNLKDTHSFGKIRWIPQRMKDSSVRFKLANPISHYPTEESKYSPVGRTASRQNGLL